MHDPNYSNEKEWRKFLLEEVRGVKSDVAELRKEVGLINSALSALKVTVAYISSCIAVVVSGAFTIGMKIIGKE